MAVTKNQFYPISFVPIRFTGFVNWLMDIKHWKMHQCVSTRTLYWLSFLGNIISHLDQTSRCCFGQYLSACFRGGQAFSSLWSWHIFDLDNSVDKGKGPTKVFLKKKKMCHLIMIVWGEKNFWNYYMSKEFWFGKSWFLINLNTNTKTYLTLWRQILCFQMKLNIFSLFPRLFVLNSKRIWYCYFFAKRGRNFVWFMFLALSRPMYILPYPTLHLPT